MRYERYSLNFKKIKIIKEKNYNLQRKGKVHKIGIEKSDM